MLFCLLQILFFFKKVFFQNNVSVNFIRHDLGQNVLQRADDTGRQSFKSSNILTLIFGLVIKKHSGSLFCNTCVITIFKREIFMTV